MIQYRFTKKKLRSHTVDCKLMFCCCLPLNSPKVTLSKKNPFIIQPSRSVVNSAPHSSVTGGSRQDSVRQLIFTASDTHKHFFVFFVFLLKNIAQIKQYETVINNQHFNMKTNIKIELNFYCLIVYRLDIRISIVSFLI